MNILKFFNLNKKIISNPGALSDPRGAEEKLKDFKHSELATAPVSVAWKEKAPTTWRSFPIFDQDGSGSCVGQMIRKMLGIENFLEEGEFVHLSARDIYSRRTNKSTAGMFFPNAMEIAKEYGVTLECLMPDDRLGESAMSNASDRKKSYEQVALIYKPSNYVEFESPLNIDEIASILATGKAVGLGFRFTYDEWTDVPSVKNDLKTLGHAVTAVDYTLWKGEKALVIEDSWGNFNAWKGRRVITETFLKARCFYAAYFIALNNNWRDNTEPSKPSFVFTRHMRFGDKGVDVNVLQQVLKYEQLFPQDIINEEPEKATYGAITAKGVLAYQKRYNVAPVAELEALAGRVVGPGTVADLNKRYK